MGNIRIGLRTVKTAAAVVVAMFVVDLYGATTSKLIFAMLGAMAAVQPTFKESLESCITQIVGVFFGAIMGMGLLTLPFPHLVQCGIGMVMIITLYNTLHIQFSPSLPCLIVVTLCTTADPQPFTYAVGRIWDSTIGLGVGMAINTLIFPYDNSRRIRDTVDSLQLQVIAFLEDMFDGDEQLPDVDKPVASIDDIGRQLAIFSNQMFLFQRKQRQQKLAVFQVCAGKAREMLAQMEVLRRMEAPGRLNEENRQRLREAGAILPDGVPFQPEELDVVTNYHVAQILTLRQELLSALEK